MDMDAMPSCCAVMQSAEIGELAAALAKAMGEVQNPARDRTVTIPGRPNYSYATLNAVFDAIRRPLAANGLWPSQGLIERGGKTCLRTVLLHSSGQWIASEAPLLPQGQGSQAFGSALTYMRRYALCALLGVVADEDDDANAADDNAAKTAPRALRAAKAAPAPPASPAKAGAAPAVSPGRPQLLALAKERAREFGFDAFKSWWWEIDEKDRAALKPHEAELAKIAREADAAGAKKAKPPPHPDESAKLDSEPDFVGEDDAERVLAP